MKRKTIPEKLKDRIFKDFGYVVERIEIVGGRVEKNNGLHIWEGNLAGGDSVFSNFTMTECVGGKYLSMGRENLSPNSDFEICVEDYEYNAGIR